MEQQQSGSTSEKKKRVRNHTPVKKKAQWDSTKHALFVKICLEQHRVGNKPGGCLNRAGYEHLQQKFNETTGEEYTRDQFKNHWDNTKKDWSNWTALKKETGLGFDTVKGTYKMTDEWWTKWAEAHPGGEKFKLGSLPHEEELDELFLGFVATGEHVYIPSAAPGCNASQSNPIADLDTQIEAQISEWCSLPEGAGTASPSLPNNHNPAYESTASSSQDNICVAQTSDGQIGIAKKQKTIGKMPSNWDRMVGVMEQMWNKTTEETVGSSSCSMENCLKLLLQTDVVKGSTEWYKALMKFEKTAVRELFVSLGNAEDRAGWVRAISSLKK